MKISIITVCYNSGRTIEDTIQSVASQCHPSVEHVVIDGASTDGTSAILARHRDKVVTLVSEPDRGVYDAMNKGLALASGDVIGFLNADDFYADDTVLAQVAAALAKDDVDACYADLIYVDHSNSARIVRYWKSQPYSEGLFVRGWVPAHPTFFVKREVYERYGGFDISYRLAADAELMMRFLDRYRIRTTYIPRVLVKMRTGGVTNRKISNIVRQNCEIHRALRANGIRINPFAFVWGKTTNRISQFRAGGQLADK